MAIPDDKRQDIDITTLNSVKNLLKTSQNVAQLLPENPPYLKHYELFIQNHHPASPIVQKLVNQLEQIYEHTKPDLTGKQKLG